MPNQQKYLQLQAGFGLTPKTVTAGMLASGVLTVPIDAAVPSGGILDLASGLELRGLVFTENAASINNMVDAMCTSVFVRCLAGSATIKHEDTGVAEPNRFRVEATSADLVVTPGRLVHLLYDQVAHRWAVHSSIEVAPVESVNGQTGAVSLNAASVGADPAGTATAVVAAHAALADPHTQYTTAAEAAAAAPVQSVNGQTGAVVLGAAAVGAESAGAAAAAGAAAVASANATSAAALAAHEAAANPHPQYGRSTRYSGTTSGSGTYTVAFADLGATPNVQATLIGGTEFQFIKVTSRSSTGFTITGYTKSVVSVVGISVMSGLAATVTNGLVVDVVMSLP